MAAPDPAVPGAPVEPDADASDAEWEAYTRAAYEYEQRNRPESRMLKVWLVVASAIGLYAAVSLVLDKLSYFEQTAAGHAPSLACNVNAVVGCGQVINTPQASIFGSMPNPVLGVVVWPALGVIGVLLLSGVSLRTWHWVGLQVGVVCAIAMVSWLQFESIFRINALCPWCMVTWAVTIPTFWAVTGRNLRRWAYGHPVAKVFYDVVPLWIVLHYLVLGGVILAHFGSRIWA